MQPVDIIVPYVNNQDPIWQAEYNKYKNSAGLKGNERFRDLHLFKYFFRSIEKNCPWCRYVFLVLSGSSQIPEWLNVNHPKLKIIYHADYIPKEFLPTFNSNVIEMFYSNIEELSDNFILCNDDFFFMKNVSFFENNKPKLSRKIQCNCLWRCAPGGDHCFVDTINNNNKLISKFTGKRPFTYQHFHVPTAHNKTFHKFIWSKFENELYNSLKDSRFRTSKNYTQWLFEDFAKISDKFSVNSNIYNNVNVFTMKDTYFNVNKYDLICFNDDINFNNKSVMNFIKAMEKTFPNESSFEK